MANPPAKPKPRRPIQLDAADHSAAIPQQTIEIINHGLGLDISTEQPDKVLAVFESMTGSVSASPYPSADMLGAYRDAGFPELVSKIITTINEENAHRQDMERFVVHAEQARLNRAQFGAQGIAAMGVLGALLGGLFGVPKSICIAVAVVAVGGPPVATIAARLLDRIHAVSR